MAGFATGLSGAGPEHTHPCPVPVPATATPACVVLGKTPPLSEPGFSHPAKGQSSSRLGGVD